MAKLGTEKKPAIMRVQTLEKAQEINSYATERGWIVIVGVEPDKMEDLTDLHKLMRKEGSPEPVAKPRLPPKISGNDYCPCRSGKKYKKCCGAPAAPAGA